MDFSNDYCIKLNPKCDICIIKKLCNYKKAENIKKLKSQKIVNIVLAIFY